jgi:uncharacterized protein
MFLAIYRFIRQYINMLSGNILPPAACRFTPTCSVYCVTAFRKYGPIVGTGKCLWRLLRCHPLSHGVYDPA